MSEVVNPEILLRACCVLSQNDTEDVLYQIEKRNLGEACKLLLEKLIHSAVVKDRVILSYVFQHSEDADWILEIVDDSRYDRTAKAIFHKGIETKTISRINADYFYHVKSLITKSLDVVYLVENLVWEIISHFNTDTAIEHYCYAVNYVYKKEFHIMLDFDGVSGFYDRWDSKHCIIRDINFYYSLGKIDREGFLSLCSFLADCGGTYCMDFLIGEDYAVVQSSLASVKEKVDEKLFSSILNVIFEGEVAVSDIESFSKYYIPGESFSFLDFYDASHAYMFSDSLALLSNSGISEKHQSLMFYAMDNMKVTFLKTVGDNISLYSEIPQSSALFDEEVYDVFINLDLLTGSDFAYLKSHLCQNYDGIFSLSKRFYSLSVLAFFAFVGSDYAFLYNRLVDQDISLVGALANMRVIETVPYQMTEEILCQITNKLNDHPLDYYVEQLNHFANFTKSEVFHLLPKMDELFPLFERLRDRDLIKYAAFQIAGVSSDWSVSDIYEHLYSSLDFTNLVAFLKFTEKEEESYLCALRNFVLSGDAKSVLVYESRYFSNIIIVSVLRDIVRSVILGQYYTWKYASTRFAEEIPVKVMGEQIEVWKEDYTFQSGGFSLLETGEFHHLFYSGYTPVRTALSWQAGTKAQSLLYNFCATKKLVLVMRDGITLGRFFVTLTAADEDNPHLVLFVEKLYTQQVKETDKNVLVSAMIEYAKGKASELGIDVVFTKYCDSQKLVEKDMSIFIPRSNIMGYFDSYGPFVSDESAGKYYSGKFQVVEESAN